MEGQLFWEHLSLLHRNVSVHTNGKLTNFIANLEAFPDLKFAVKYLHIRINFYDIPIDVKETLLELIPDLEALKQLVVECSVYDIEETLEDLGSFGLPESLDSLILTSQERVDEYKDDLPDPKFYWDDPNFSERLAQFPTIKRFSIYTDAYPVQPPTSITSEALLLINMTKDLPPHCQLQAIYIHAGMKDESERCEKEGWIHNVWGEAIDHGSCYAFCKRAINGQGELEFSPGGVWGSYTKKMIRDFHPPIDEDALMAPGRSSNLDWEFF